MCDQLIKKNAAKSASPHVKLTATDHVTEDETGDRSPCSVDRRGTSGLSKLRFFSPAASPSAGILRKRQLSTDSVTANDQSPTSPSAKVCRCLRMRLCVESWYKITINSCSASFLIVYRRTWASQ